MVENSVGRQCWGGWIGVCTGSLRLIALNQSSKRLRTCDLSSPKLKGRGDPRKLNEGGGDEEVVEGESSAKVLSSKNGSQGRVGQDSANSPTNQARADSLPRYLQSLPRFICNCQEGKNKI